jgi:hypothetical protein
MGREGLSEQYAASSLSAISHYQAKVNPFSAILRAARLSFAPTQR